MVVGIPKEIKGQEYRVALLPSGAYQLIKRGHQVIVERSAGAGAGYPDADYDQAGATLVSEHAAVFEKADLVVKVKEPQPSEYPLRSVGRQVQIGEKYLAGPQQGLFGRLRVFDLDNESRLFGYGGIFCCLAFSGNYV